MIAASLVLGGASRSGFLSDTILALLAIPLLAWGIWRLFDTEITRQMRWALWFCLALVALPLLQLVPLPGWLWTLLPHREISAESFALIGQERALDANKRLARGDLVERVISASAAFSFHRHASAWLPRSSVVEPRDHRCRRDRCLSLAFCKSLRAPQVLFASFSSPIRLKPSGSLQTETILQPSSMSLFF